MKTGGASSIVVIILLVVGVVLGYMITFDTEQTEPSVSEEGPIITHAMMAREIMEGMSLEEKVGQLFFGRCPINGRAAEDVVNYHLGGYLLFADFFTDNDMEGVRRDILQFQDVAAIPLAVGVDEEGGRVVRVSRYSEFRETPFQSPRDLYQQGGMEAIVEETREKADLLTSLGIQVNWAPVADITTNQEDFMYGRSLGESPEITGEYVTKTVQVNREKNLSSMLKHFPGYGNNSDTHGGFALDRRDFQTFWDGDLIPFAKGIEENCEFILMSHVIAVCRDEIYPVSLSKSWNELLRDTMGYQGIIITDDLKMGAITQSFGVEESAVLAFQAGNDMVCSSDYDKQIPAVIQGVKEGRVSQEQIETSVVRVLEWKLDVGILPVTEENE